MTNDEKQAMLEALEGVDGDAGYSVLEIPIEAYVVYADNYGYDMSDFDDWRDAAHEAYEGDFDSDADFATNMAEETGALRREDEWPYTCIDWEHAARELMYDYFSDNNYYFRSV